jgi:hypothetical protein
LPILPIYARWPWRETTARRTLRKLRRLIENARKGIPHCVERKSVQLTFDQLETRYCMTAGITLYSVSGAPLQITTGADGNVWFTETESGTGAIGKLTPTGTLTEYGITSGYQPVALTLGPDGNVWYTSSGNVLFPGSFASKITTSGVISNYDLDDDSELDPDSIAASFIASCAANESFCGFGSLTLYE